MKKILSLLLGIVMSLTVMLVVVPPIEVSAATTLTENEFAAKIEELQVRYPHKQYWNEYNGTETIGGETVAKAGTIGCNGTRTDEAHYGQKCSSVGFCYYCTCKCGEFHGWQCFGFANLMAYHTFGSYAVSPSHVANTSTGWNKLTSVSTFYAGDVVRIDKDAHSIFIHKVTDTDVYYVDCNSGVPCQIEWNNKVSISNLKSRVTYVVRMSGNTLKGTDFNDYVHIKDDSYDTNFKAFPYAKITNDNLFDAGHNKMNANNWIAATDECTILEVYTDGCCKVTYPLDSGGTRTLYSKISLFNIVYDCDHSYTYKSNSSGHWKECVQCGEKQTTSSHTYTNNCDNSCNTCGYTRTTTHTYTNSCDTSCNVCGYTRTTTHTYTNSCDTNCNVCGSTRTITHTYNHDCDTDCNVCGATRTTTHSYGTYSHDSDIHWRTCTICGYVSTPSYPYHYYTYDCDTDCNECGYIREAVEEHIWMPPDPTDESTHTCPCRYCEAVDIRQHVYTNVCDTSCNHCKYERTIIHTYDNDCDPNCNVCSETRSTEHVYDNEQDTTCNICNAVKTVETLPSSTPDETEPSTKPSGKPDTDDTQSNSNKNNNNDDNDDEDDDNTTIIVVAIAGAVTVSAVSILGTALVMKKKR